MSAHAEFLAQWFHEVWSNQNQDAIDEFLASSAETQGLGANVPLSHSEFKLFHTSMCELISNIDITLDNVVDSDPWISALVSLRATSVKTGSPVVMTGQVQVRIENGQIQEAHHHWDFIGLWEQLGLLPTDSFATCLSERRPTHKTQKVVRAFPISSKDDLETLGREIDSFEPAASKAAFFENFDDVVEDWYVQDIGDKPYVIGIAEAPRLEGGYNNYANLNDEFSLWFKDRVEKLTGYDVNETPKGPPSALVYTLKAPNRSE